MLTSLLSASLALAVPPTIEGAVASFADTYGVDGFAAVVVPATGEPIFIEHGVDQRGDPFAADTRCGLFSASKALSSIAFVKLHEAGVIDLDAPLSSYRDDLPEAWRDIPFHTLLNHSSGLPMVVTTSEFEEMQGDTTATNEDLVALIREAPLDYPTGSRSRYRQSGYALAEWLVSKRTGETWNTLMQRLVYGPAGLSETGHEPLVAGGAEFLQSAGGTSTTARDMARLLVAMRDGHVTNLAAWKAAAADPRYLVDGYGLGLITAGDGVDFSVGHQGGGRSNVRFATTSGAGMMLCTDDQSNHGFHADMGPLLLEFAGNGLIPEPTLKVAMLDALNEGALELIVPGLEKTLNEAADGSEAKRLVNQLGYEMMREGRSDVAVYLFARNLRDHGEEAGLWDSLGDGLESHGDREGAVSAFAQALAIDPDLEPTRAKLERLTAEIG